MANGAYPAEPMHHQGRYPSVPYACLNTIHTCHPYKARAALSNPKIQQSMQWCLVFQVLGLVRGTAQRASDKTIGVRLLNGRLISSALIASFDQVEANDNRSFVK